MSSDKKVEIKVQRKDDTNALFPGLDNNYLNGKIASVGIVEEGLKGPEVVFCIETEDSKSVLVRLDCLEFDAMSQGVNVLLSKIILHLKDSHSNLVN